MPGSKYQTPQLRGPDAQRPSSTTAPVSSHNSSPLDHHSKSFRFMSLTPLDTVIDSVDTIFADGPDLQPLTRFLAPVAWNNPTDKQRRLYALVSEVVEGAEKASLKNLDKAFVREAGGDLCWTDEDFDAVAAVRARLMKDEQTIMTQRALEIIGKRSGFAATSATAMSLLDGEYSLTRKDAVEEIEDYAADFEFGASEEPEIPATPNIGGIRNFVDGDYTLGTIEEIDENMEQDCLFDEEISPSQFRHATDIVAPPTPVIRPVDAAWDYHSFSPDTSASIANSISVSRLIMSPLVLGSPTTTSSPAIFRNSSENKTSVLLSSPSPRFCSKVVALFQRRFRAKF